MFNLQKKAQTLMKWDKFYILDSNQRHRSTLSCAQIELDKEVVKKGQNERS